MQNIFYCGGKGAAPLAIRITSRPNSRYRYVQLCRSLKTYGMTSFNVKTKDPIKKNKLKDLTVGVTRESVIFMDFETKVYISHAYIKTNA